MVENYNYCACTNTNGKYKIKLNQQGPQGRQGAQGAQGADGISPSVTVVTNTADEYILKIDTAFNSFLTPNLLGNTSELENTINNLQISVERLDTAITDKQDKLTQGKNIIISNNRISTTNSYSFPSKDNIAPGPGITNTIAGIIFESNTVNGKARPLLTATYAQYVNGQQVGSTNENIPLVYEVRGSDKIQVTNHDGIITIETNLEPYSLPIATDSVLGGIKVGENLEITSEGILNALVPTVDLNEKYGIKGDYSTHYGILDCPNGLIEIVSGKQIKVNPGIVLQCAGVDNKTTIASEFVKQLESSTPITLFYAGGEILECGDVFYQEDEPENGTSNYVAWFKPSTGKWQFKSNDTGNVFREAIATPIANINLTDTDITRIDYIGYRILDDEIYALKSDIPESVDLTSINEAIAAMQNTIVELQNKITALETNINGGNA